MVSYQFEPLGKIATATKQEVQQSLLQDWLDILIQKEKLEEVDETEGSKWVELVGIPGYLFKNPQLRLHKWEREANSIDMYEDIYMRPNYFRTLLTYELVFDEVKIKL